jgi:hypothetical protein
LIIAEKGSGIASNQHCLPAFLSQVNILSAARTVVTILFTSDVDLFLLVLLAGTRRKVGGDRRVLTFPSDALLSVGKIDLALDVSLFDGFLSGAVLVGRREDAEGNGNAGVKVQVADLEVRENVFSPLRRQEGISCFLVERRRGKRACLTTLLDSRVFQGGCS